MSAHLRLYSPVIIAHPYLSLSLSFVLSRSLALSLALSLSLSLARSLSLSLSLSSPLPPSLSLYHYLFLYLCLSLSLSLLKCFLTNKPLLLRCLSPFFLSSFLPKGLHPSRKHELRPSSRIRSPGGPCTGLILRWEALTLYIDLRASPCPEHLADLRTVPQLWAAL